MVEALALALEVVPQEHVVYLAAVVEGIEIDLLERL
jgi:hypothetical protein